MNPAVACSVAHEIIDLQTRLTRVELPRDRLIKDMVQAIQADLHWNSVERSAGLMARAVKIRDEAGLALPEIRKIQTRKSRLKSSKIMKEMRVILI